MVSKVSLKRRLQQCSSPCKWSDADDKCENPMTALMQKAMECSSKTSVACTGDCEWKQDENKCDLNGAVAMQAMMGAAGGANNPMAGLMQKAMECSSKESGAC